MGPLTQYREWRNFLFNAFVLIGNEYRSAIREDRGFAGIPGVFGGLADLFWTPDPRNDRDRVIGASMYYELLVLPGAYRQMVLSQPWQLRQ